MPDPYVLYPWHRRRQLTWLTLIGGVSQPAEAHIPHAEPYPSSVYRASPLVLRGWVELYKVRHRSLSFVGSTTGIVRPNRPRPASAQILCLIRPPCPTQVHAALNMLHGLSCSGKPSRTRMNFIRRRKFKILFSVSLIYRPIWGHNTWYPLLQAWQTHPLLFSEIVFSFCRVLSMYRCNRIEAVYKIFCIVMS